MAARTSRRGHGQGGIRKRGDGRWEASVDLGFENGKRRRRFFYGRTRPEVAAKLREAQTALSAGRPLPSGRQTTGAFLEAWAADVLPGTVKARTLQSYRDVLRSYVLPEVGSVPLAKLSPAHVQAMLRALEARGLSPRTQRYARAVLRRALHQAERWGDVTRNAAALADPPAQERSERPTLSLDQARHLLETVRGDRLEALYWVALSLGLRQGEALALRWADVDLETGRLTVAGTLSRVSGQGLVRTSPKTNRARVVVLSEPCAAALRAHRRRQLEDRLVAGSEWEETGYVFTTETGRALDARNVTRRWHRAREQAGLPALHFHDLRHSAATLLLEQGVPITTISKQLGHASITITSDVYAHVTEGLQRESAETMARLLG